MKTFSDHWREYRDKVYPDGMVPDQNRQLHQAFFAAGLVFCGIQGDLAKLPDDQAVAELAKLTDEITAVNKANALGHPYRNQSNRPGDSSN